MLQQQHNEWHAAAECMGHLLLASGSHAQHMRAANLHDVSLLVNGRCKLPCTTGQTVANNIRIYYCADGMPAIVSSMCVQHGAHLPGRRGAGGRWKWQLRRSYGPLQPPARSRQEAVTGSSLHWAPSSLEGGTPACWGRPCSLCWHRRGPAHQTIIRGIKLDWFSGQWTTNDLFSCCHGTTQGHHALGW